MDEKIHPFQKKISFLVIDDLTIQQLSDFKTEKLTGTNLTFRIIKSPEDPLYIVQKFDLENSIFDLKSLILNLTGNLPFLLEFYVQNQNRA